MLRKKVVQVMVYNAWVSYIVRRALYRHHKNSCVVGPAGIAVMMEGSETMDVPVII